MLKTTTRSSGKIKNQGGGDSKMIDELRERVRKLEKTVWGASAVIAALITIAGIASALESKELPTIQSEVISHAENH